MGELLRRYWQPIAAVARARRHPTKPVRLMGEDLVLYRDQRRHATACSTATARTAAPTSPTASSRTCGLRCNYHGWLFDETARCLEQPFEEIAHPEARFKERDRDQGLPGRGEGRPALGLPGPEPAPLLPDWDRLPRQRLRADRVLRDPCNWFQCQENSIDPVHFEWLHSNWSLRCEAQRRPAVADAPEGRLRRVRVRLHLPAHPRGHDRGRRAVDRRPRLPLAELPVHRQPLRVARADRRREHAERRLVLRPRARATQPFEQERIPYWYGADQG